MVDEEADDLPAVTVTVLTAGLRGFWRIVQEALTDGTGSMQE